MVEDVAGTAANLATIIDPDALSPIPVATGLRCHQMKQSVAIAMLVGGPAGLDRLFKKKRTGTFHGAKQGVVAANPGNIVRPTTPFDMESRIFLSKIFRNLKEFFRALAGIEAVPDALLKQRLKHREIAFANA